MTVLRRTGVLALLFIASAAPCILSSCKRNISENDIVLPATPPLSRSVIGYGVVSGNYTRILDKPGDDGNSIGFIRKGSIIKILERRPVVKDEKAETWVFASGSYIGWLKENELRVYTSMAQALTASQAASR
jgi:hypothetical protein